VLTLKGKTQQTLHESSVREKKKMKKKREEEEEEK
jgi:hypothetical protein